MRARRLASVVAFVLSAAWGGTVASADGPDDEVAYAHAGLTAALPKVEVERFPLGEVFPVPRPGIAPERLRMVALDGSPLLDVQPFDAHGEPRPAAFRAIEQAFASRSGASTAIDPRLVELLMQLSLAFDGAPIKLVSAHREAGSGTKRTSFHVRGMAADVAIQGVSVYELRDAALRLGAWGVGLYPSFVHIDARTDRPYTWVGSAHARWGYLRWAQLRAQAKANHAQARSRKRR